MYELLKLSMQMFADPNTQTTILAATGNDLSPEMKTYYEKQLIRNAKPKLVHHLFGMMRPIPKGGGKTIEYRRFSPLPKNTVALQEGVTPDGNHLNVSQLTATIAQYGDYVTTSDLLDMTAIDPIFEETVAQLADQAGRSIDTLDRDVLIGGEQSMFAPTISGETVTAVTDRSEISANTLLTVREIFKAVAELEALNVPKINGRYVAIIHPYVEMDLMLSDDWKESVKYTDSNQKISDGEIGTIGNVMFYKTSEAKIIAPSAICGVLPNRLSLRTALDAETGSVDIFPTVAIAAADKDAITAAIAAGAVYKIYVGGTEGTVASVTAGAAGTGKITLSAVVKNKAVGTVICGMDAGADGSAVFLTLVLGANAYGITSIEGGGLQNIIKPLGSGDDPLNMRATAGWKTTHVCKRLVEEYMMRIEHGSSYSANAQTN